MKPRKSILLINLTILCILFITAGCCNLLTNQTGSGTTLKVENVSAQEAYELIQENNDNRHFVILDIRTPEEYAGGHIENAINVNFNAPSFQGIVLAFDKSKTYLMHCRSGGRSTKALAIMQTMSFKKIYHMNDGILGWNAAELPLITE